MATSKQNPYKPGSRNYKKRAADLAAEALAAKKVLAASDRALSKPAEKLISETRAALMPTKKLASKPAAPKPDPIITAERVRVRSILAAAGARQAEQGQFLAFETDLATDMAIGVLRLSQRQ